MPPLSRNRDVMDQPTIMTFSSFLTDMAVEMNQRRDDEHRMKGADPLLCD